MKSDFVQEMDVVPAALPVTPSTELHLLLGDVGATRLGHLMSGRAVFVPGFLPGRAPITSDERSPRVRFLTGTLYQDSAGTWHGPVLLESAQWRATYLDPQLLAHHDCSICAPTWARASAFARGFQIDELEVSPGVIAQIAGPHARRFGRGRHLRSA